MTPQKAPENAWDEFVKGLWRRTRSSSPRWASVRRMAVTNSLMNALVMGAATTFVLVGSSLLVSTFRNVIPQAGAHLGLHHHHRDLRHHGRFHPGGADARRAQAARRVHLADRGQLPDPGPPGGVRLAEQVRLALADAVGMALGFTLALSHDRRRARDPGQRQPARVSAVRRELRALGDHGPAARRLPRARRAAGVFAYIKKISETKAAARASR